MFRRKECGWDLPYVMWRSQGVPEQGFEAVTYTTPLCYGEETWLGFTLGWWCDSRWPCTGRDERGSTYPPFLRAPRSRSSGLWVSALCYLYGSLSHPAGGIGRDVAGFSRTLCGVLNETLSR